MGKNKIVGVGGMGQFICFLNVDKEEAIKRYKAYFSLPEDSLKYTIFEFEFNDSFWVYDAWPHAKR
jgi:hypothetical protein